MLKLQTKNFFKTVMKFGGLFNSKHFSLKTVNKNVSKPEIKIIISKKVISSAVKRNKLRRRIRGIFNKTKNNDIWAVFYTKKGSGELSYIEIKSEVEYLLRRLKK